MKHLRLSQAVAQALAPPGAVACPSPAPSSGRWAPKRRQGGFSLVETVVTFSLIALLSAGVYTIYGPASVGSTVQSQATNLNNLRRGVDSAYRTRGSFNGISVEQGVLGNWLPGRMINDTTWGTFSLAAAKGSKDDDSWRASYAAVPLEACEKLVSLELGHWDVVLVNDQAIASASEGVTACTTRPTSKVAFQTYGGVKVDPDALPPLVLAPGAPTAPTSPIYNNPPTPQPPVVVTPSPTSPGAPGTPVTNPPAAPDAPGVYGPPNSPGGPPAPTYTPCVAPPPVITSHSCTDKGAYSGTYSTAVNATCSGPYGTVSYSAPQPYSDGCVALCSAPQGITETSNQNANCPSGTVTPPGASYVEQTRTRPVTYACPPGAPSYTTNYGPYTAWTPATTSACAPKCNIPLFQTRTVACPSGQVENSSPYGSQGISQARTASCPTPTGPYVWNPWTQTGNTCTPVCTPPPPNTGCGPCSDFNGFYSDGRNYGGTYCVTSDASCATPVGPVTWGPSVLTSSNCATTNDCHAPTNTSQGGSQTASCPSGQVTPAGATTFTQTHSRSVTYSCPGAYGSYTTAYGAYSPWSPAASSACAPRCNAPGPSSAGESQNAGPYSGACTGQFRGYDYTYVQPQTRTRTTSYSCPSPTGGYTSGVSYTPWVNSAPAIITSPCPTCVSVDTFVVVRRDSIEKVMQAGEVREGDELYLMNPGSGAKRWGEVTYSKTTPADSVFIRTESGIELTCSKSAPIGLADGGQVLAGDLLHKIIATDEFGVYGSSRVVEVKSVGEIDVQHITCENDFFLAGAIEGRYVAHHNKKPGYCVNLDAVVWARRDGVEQRLRAGDVCVGDELRVMNQATGELTWGAASYSKTTHAPAVRVETESGVTLTCSTMAPLGLATGGQALSVYLEGKTIAVFDHGVYGAQRVVSVEAIGDIAVQHIDVPEGFFLVGDQDDRFVTHCG